MVALLLNLLDAGSFESTLSISRNDLRSEAGYYLGYGRSSANWTSRAEADIDEVVKSGLRQFYSPPIEHVGSYRWYFLKPAVTFATVASQEDYDLPDNFGSIDGRITFEAGKMYPPIEMRSEGQIRALREAQNGNGVPQYYSVRWKSSTGISGQRAELLLWPAPDAVYTLSYKYAVLPNALSADNPWPLGGEEHAETILQSCRAAADRRINGRHGEEWDLFITMLRSSILRDSRLAPESLGYNADDSSGDRYMVTRNHLTRYNGMTS
jgi:hypothetical protein